MCRRRFLVAIVALSMLVQGSAVLGAGGSLIGRWMCDEGQGNTVSDSSGNKRHGKFVNGAAAWVPGHAGSAVKLVAPTLVEIPSINMTLSEATMAGWVLADGQQPNWSAIIMHRGSGSAHGFNLTADDGRPALAYHWNDDSGTWNYRSNAVYPLSEWTHCALTITPTRATFYINGAEASANAVRHNPANWNQVFYLGGDGGSGYVDRRMKGALDDVMMFSRALNAEQVAGLMNGVVPVFTKAEKPNPVNGQDTGVVMAYLTWTPGETVVWEDVYLGTTPELTAADRVSQQSTILKFFMKMDVVPGQTYYWRIDSLNAAKQLIATGDVWSFTVTPLVAYKPAPADGALYQSVETDLAWAGGQNAVTHDLYFGTNKDDVANGAASVFKGSLYDASFPLPPLELETTYYWRVDETDMSDTKQAGEVWSFTTTIPGLGFAKRELWMNSNANSTIADIYADARYPGSPTDVNDKMPNFESPAGIADSYIGRLSAWLHVPVAGDYTFWVASDDAGELFLGPDPDSAVVIAHVNGWTNAQEWDKEGGQRSEPIALEAGRYYIMMHWKDGGGGDNGSAAWQGPGIPTRQLIAGSYLMPFEALWAYGPRPRNAEPNVPQTGELRWISGTRAATHQVYFSEDRDAVANGEPGGPAYRGEQAADVTSYSAGQLEFNKTYYWRVDEVNAAEADSPWKGTVWSFTTADFIVVEDFESYTNDSPNRIFQTWIDGWGFSEDEFFPAGNPGNSTGSTIGHDIWTAGTSYKTIVETSIVAPGGSRQSMPFEFDNGDSPYYSEAERTFTLAQNWTTNGVDTLSLKVHGYAQVTSTPVTETGGKMSLTGAGADIWGTSDEFTFAYKTLNGDGSLLAKVVSNGTGSSTWAKGGVMIRDSLEGRSASAQMVLTGGDGNGGAFQNRATAGLDMNANDAASNVTMATAIAPPYWVKIERRGDTITGSISADGATWTPVNSVDIAMTAPVYIGLCVTSHAAGQDRTFQFEGIKTTGSVAGEWQGAVIDSPRYNTPQNLYVVLQDSNNKVAVVTDTTAVISADWVEVRMPLSSFTGVTASKIKKIVIGVGDRNASAAGGAGMVFIDDIRVIKPEK